MDDLVEELSECGVIHNINCGLAPDQPNLYIRAAGAIAGLSERVRQLEAEKEDE